MTVTTVLLADLRPLLEDIVYQLLQGCPNLQIIRGSAKGRGLAAAAAAAEARLVVVSCADPANLQAVGEDFAHAASLSVFALNEDGSSGCLHSVQCATTRFDDLSSAALMVALGVAAPKGQA
jgi:hypothetical protein